MDAQQAKYNMTTDIPASITTPDIVETLVDRCITDMGGAGPDQGNGGKYILLPPRYTGNVSEGYFLFIRGYPVNGDPRPAVENTKKIFCIYPLDCAANLPAMNFIDITWKNYNSVESNDASVFEQVAQVVHEEPLEAVEQEI